MQVSPDVALIYPLDEFYERAGLPLPPIAAIGGHEVPEPYRDLLVHARDMTPTLENAYGRAIRLRVLERSIACNVISREVVLVPEGSNKPAAFGVIKINLDRFSEPARAQVLECREPLGAILRSHSICHSSQPDVFLCVSADPLISRALQLAESCMLFGRRNVLRDGDGQTLAQVVEILPPANGVNRE